MDPLHEIDTQTPMAWDTKCETGGVINITYAD